MECIQRFEIQSAFLAVFSLIGPQRPDCEFLPPANPLPVASLSASHSSAYGDSLPCQPWRCWNVPILSWSLAHPPAHCIHLQHALSSLSWAYTLPPLHSLFTVTSTVCTALCRHCSPGTSGIRCMSVRAQNIQHPTRQSSQSVIPVKHAQKEENRICTWKNYGICTNGSIMIMMVNFMIEIIKMLILHKN